MNRSTRFHMSVKQGVTDFTVTTRSPTRTARVHEQLAALHQTTPETSKLIRLFFDIRLMPFFCT